MKESNLCIQPNRKMWSETEYPVNYKHSTGNVSTITSGKQIDARTCWLNGGGSCVMIIPNFLFFIFYCCLDFVLPFLLDDLSGFSTSWMTVLWELFCKLLFYFIFNASLITKKIKRCNVVSEWSKHMCREFYSGRKRSSHVVKPTKSNFSKIFHHLHSYTSFLWNNLVFLFLPGEENN